MKAKLIINDKEYEVEMTDEQVQDLEKKQIKTGYEEVGRGQYYYFFRSSYIENVIDSRDAVDKEMYDIANYYSDRTVAENNARADKLYRQLRRFAVENREKPLKWDNNIQSKNAIYYDFDYKSLLVGVNQAHKYFGIVYFDTEETAQSAIDIFRDELLWYFTEYKDSL